MLNNIFWESPIFNDVQDNNALALIAFVISFVSAALIVQLHKLFFKLDRSLSDVQVAHLVPTPRYGGLALFVSIAVSVHLFQLKSAMWILI